MCSWNEGLAQRCEETLRSIICCLNFESNQVTVKIITAVR